MLPQALLQRLEALNPSVYRHGSRVGYYARLMGTVMGLTEDTMTKLDLAARLHDIGKLFIPSFLVHKQMAFNEEEYRIMQGHSVMGARLLAGHPETMEFAQVARHHHDRWDGHGYPARLAGYKIPVLARITSVADAYDGMTSNRYGGNRSHDEAICEIIRCRGTQFCPETVDALLQAESQSWAMLES
jgi:HD-GYP domain-containing protein (c-di-GMP phosphodiesterase class II)